MAVCCFTGHRFFNVVGLVEYNYTTNWVREQLSKRIKMFYTIYNVTHWISGGAVGTDQIAAEEVLKYKKDYNFHLTIMKAFPSQDEIWPVDIKEKFHKICNDADLIIDCSDNPYEPCKMQFRNETMVNISDYIIAVWNGKKGGTDNCVRYAMSEKKPIYRIDPNKKENYWIKY